MSCSCTQLQDAIDELAIQFYTILEYLNTSHDFVPLNGQVKMSDPSVQPEDPIKLKEMQHQFSIQLIEKIKQIDRLIEELPGIFETQQQQLDYLSNLQKQLEILKKSKNHLISQKKILESQFNPILIYFSSFYHQILSYHSFP